MLLQPPSKSSRDNDRPKSHDVEVPKRSKPRTRIMHHELRPSLVDELDRLEIEENSGNRIDDVSSIKKEKISSPTYSRRLGSPPAVTRERFSDARRPIAKLGVSDHFAVDMNNQQKTSIKHDDLLKHRFSTGSTINCPPDVHGGSSYEPVSHRNLNKPQEQSKAENFRLELGGHQLFRGIHQNINKLEKRLSRSKRSNSSGSKPVKADPLAYGEFTADHLAYPEPPSRRSYEGFSGRLDPQLKPSSNRYNDPLIASPTKPIQMASRRNPNADFSSKDRSGRRQTHDLNLENRFVNEPKKYHVGSPLSNSYRGTYQPESSKLSPILVAADYSTSPSSLDERDAGYSNRKLRRTARFHDPKEEAKLLAEALKGDKRFPDTAPLISILPGLTHSQVLELRVQYKELVRIGREMKGVNIAKHIKTRLKDQPCLMRACYTCALGQWESEAYWVNYWYQNQKNRREFLIESLMGHSNEEIRLIKSGFRDKKYQNSLSQCLQMELRDDKFKLIMKIVLEENRMDEHPDGLLDKKLMEADVQELHNAILSKNGDENAIIRIVTLRSETHLRKVLKVYNTEFGKNFAKEMLKKSGNHLGEILAHILNGVINAPLRDARLLHNAINLPRSDSIWCELLTSRLVRYHWNRPHIEQVRSEFRHLYNIELQACIAESIPGDFGLFLQGLCVRRMEDDVRILPAQSR